MIFINSKMFQDENNQPFSLYGILRMPLIIRRARLFVCIKKKKTLIKSVHSCMSEKYTAELDICDLQTSR